MKRYFLGLFYIVLVFCGVMSCGRGAKNATAPNEIAAENQSGQQAATPRVFVPQLAPAMMPQEEKIRYMAEHYWDKFDFADTVFINEIEPQRMLTAMAVYARGYVPDSLAHRSMTALMQKASTSKRMFEYFLMLANGVLHDPNSPLRDDERYIPVLEAAIASPLLDEYEKMPYEYDLKIARQNRVGHQANDFYYTTADSKRCKMHNVEAEYLIIFISNPGCPMCREVKETLLSSPQLNLLAERGKLKVLVLYPDTDLDAWRAHLGDYPDAWINGYDANQTITKENLYDLRAIPALYLLDREKRVMAKDCTDVAYIESLIMQAEEK
ncbi:MAG: DUF5106 domain-containing protein [Alistipes sp.]|nr:DUF5106 domain-containing protein [Alistipes sp.]